MSRNTFKIAVEVDGADIESVNRKLSRLPDPLGSRAMKNGFREFFKRVRATARGLAPKGRPTATEKVRGEVKPNPHIRNFLAYTVRGYRRGTVVWAAFGVREKRGSYETPHWYLRWVEFGHDIKRAATEEEQIRLAARGERRYKTIKIGSVKGQFFIRRSYEANAGALIPIMEQKIADQIAKEFGNG